MKKILLTFALAIAMSVPAFAATTIGDWGSLKGTADYLGTQKSSVLVGKAANGLVFSRHNLSSYGEHYQATTSVEGTSTATGIEPLSVATTEICVFCHTPHFGKTDTAPIWNRGSAAQTYIAYGTTVGGTAIAALTNTTGGSSLACLSCHDGVTTLDNLINKPGKGSETNGTGKDSGWMFGEVGNFIGDTANYGDTSEANILDTGKASSRLNIGAANDGLRSVTAVSLANDHPINVAYNAGVSIPDGEVGRASLRPTGTTISSISMNNARMNYGDSISHGLVEGTGYFGETANLWASRGAISNTATIGDLLRDDGKVQCASCHDPHYKNQTNSDPSVVCSYFKTKAKWVAPDPYTDEEETPTFEGCYSASTAGTVAPTVSGIDFGTLTVGDMSAFNEHYLSDVDSDGLFLRRVGGNSNSGVCRTCHNK